MELLRLTLGLDPQAYGADVRLAEVAFGAWEGFTGAEMRAHSPKSHAERERDKWGFTPPGGESYATMSLRMREWYDTLARDTVAVAHGGTLRGLVVQLGLAKWVDAPFIDVSTRVVVEIRPGR